MIRKGEAWGEPVTLNGHEPAATTDAELAAILRPDDHPPLVVLTDGDLHHSLGGRPGPEPLALPIDVLDVSFDGRTTTAVAHVVARGRWWAGPFAVGMNATHLGEWNLGPKAHPNDGLVDVTRGRMGLRDRLAARRRAPAANHLPHPTLVTERLAVADWAFERPRTIWVDGVRAGRARSVSIRVVPDRGVIALG